jgi:thiol:disulfide interchange protein
MTSADELADAPAGGARRPIALIAFGYVATVLAPLIGIFVGFFVLTRRGQWAKRQAMLIVVLAVVLAAFRFSLASMLADSYFAGKERQQLNAVAKETRTFEEEDKRQLAAELKKTREEGAAELARIRRETGSEPVKR